MLFEEFDEGCKVHGHLLHLSGMKETLLNFFLVGLSNQVSAHENMWFGGSRL